MHGFETEFAIVRTAPTATPPAPWQVVTEAGETSADPALISSTADGWRVERLPVAWPNETVLLLAPGFVDYVSGGFWKLTLSPEIEAAGFSSDGSTLTLRVAGATTRWRRLG